MELSTSVAPAERERAPPASCTGVFLPVTSLGTLSLVPLSGSQIYQKEHGPLLSTLPRLSFRDILLPFDAHESPEPHSCLFNEKSTRRSKNWTCLLQGTWSESLGPARWQNLTQGHPVVSGEARTKF